MINNILFKEQRLNYFTTMCIFFSVGLFTSINAILVTYFKNSLHISYAQANLISMVYFLAYLVMSIPFGTIAHKYSYKLTMQVSIFLGVVGCLLFPLSVYLNSFYALLATLFIIASFVTGIEVAANPLVDGMGPPKTSAQRLTIVHFFDSVGTIIGPQFAAFIFFYSITALQVQDKTMYLYLLLVLFLSYFLIVVSKKIPKKNIENQVADSLENIDVSKLSIFQHKRLIFGIVALFCYVGCEVSIANFLISFSMLPSISTFSREQAAIWISFYWLGQLIGRLFGVIYLGKTNTHISLAICGLLAFLLILTGILANSRLSLYLIVFVGLANSIMYPSIFSLAVFRLGALKSKASGLLHMGVVGGAIVPILQGILADNYGVRLSYLLPCFLYLFIIYYALLLSRQ